MPGPSRTSFSLAPYAAIAFAAIVSGAFVGSQAIGNETEDAAFFREKIEPILKARCFGCHSHDSGEMNGGLALDFRSGWFEGGDHGPAAIPGKSNESLMIKAVRREGDLAMPPEEPLPAEEVATLVAWIDRGAFDPRTVDPAPVATFGPEATNWWSLRPLVRPAIPDGAESASPIDAFLKAEPGTPPIGPEADRRTLARRLAFDLLGLPPTEDEVAEFLADEHPLAYERLVDRWMASPRYGERLARAWLDVIHYADTHGSEHDVIRPNAWRYRDYVIDAFNDDTPWPTFVREQLAADALKPEDPKRLAAIGFLGAGPFDYSAYNTAPMNFDYTARDDLVTQTMAAFTSVTVNCARCHNHKFDPISHEDHYRLQAVFAGVGFGDVSIDTDPETARARKLWEDRRKAAEARDTAALDAPELKDLVDAWEKTLDRAKTQWTAGAATTIEATDGSTLTRVDADGSYFAGDGPRPEKETYRVGLEVPATGLTALRLDVLTDDRLPMKGPGRQDNGNLHLSEVEIDWTAPGVAPKRLKFARAAADFDQQGWTIQHAIDGNPDTAWGIHPAVGQPHQAMLVLAEPLPAAAGGTLSIALKQLHGRHHTIGRFQLWTTSAEPSLVEFLPGDVVAALAKPAGERSDVERTAVASHVIGAAAKDALAKLPPAERIFAAGSTWRLVPGGDNNPTTLAAPKTVHMLKRGDVAKPLKAVEPGALTALVELSDRFALPAGAPESARRVTLADWIVDARNPLSWRSVANRLWQWRFGRGICETPSDFGRQGATPTHPALLDWLACELRDQGGSLKRLDRALVTSAAYRARRKHGEFVEPRRLDAEMWRDAVNAASGALDTRMGGPGVQNFSLGPGIQLTPTVIYAGYDWGMPGASRRAVYRFVYRGIPDPLLDALDFPDMSILQPTRPLSASALQALALFNHDFTLHHSKRLAERSRLASEALQGRVEHVVRSVLSREPTAEELAEFVDLADRHGVEAVARTLFNSADFLYVE